MANHNELGKKGEDLAVDYLVKLGYTILTRNYRYLKAEVDIIAKRENTLVAVEVKTRTTSYFGNPEEFINQKKIQLIVLATNNYIVENNINFDVRFDVISVLKLNTNFKIEHIKDAFLHF